MTFEQFWDDLQNNLYPGLTIPNWTVFGGYNGNELNILAVEESFVSVEFVDMQHNKKSTHKPNKTDFEKIFTKWADHTVNKTLTVTELKSVSGKTTYVVSVIKHLEASKTQQELNEEFEIQLKVARGLPDSELKKRIQNASHLPTKVQVLTTNYRRNPHVVEFVLRRADGKCELCGCDAPFVRKSDGTLYLEVHHRKMLSDGGEDTIENAQALCPNCHREAHFGV